jgi:hypothetical protein
MIVSGLLLTAGSFSNPNRGSAVIYGMMIVGCIWLVRGLGRLRAIAQLPPLRTENPIVNEEAD